MTLPDYAELHALSNFSFQRGASHPEELVERAQALGYRALALTDECSVAGVVRAHQAARACGLPFIPGAEFRLHQQALRLLVLPHNAQGWGHLCEFITAARQAGQGSAAAYRVAHGETAFERLQACEIILCPLPEQPINPVALADQLGWAAQLWRGRLWLAVHLQQRLDDALRLEQLEQLAERYGVPLLASAQSSGLPPGWFFAAAAPLAMIGAWLGGMVLDRMSDTSFLKWTRWIVTAIGVVYLVQAAVLFSQ